MELIQMAREMGKEIQKSEVYKKLVEAKEKNDSDAELQDLIGQYGVEEYGSPLFTPDAQQE